MIAFKDKRIIKILTGIRRCGKTVFLKIYQDRLREYGIREEQIISINFEDIDNEELTDLKKLTEYLEEHLVKEEMNYVFLDEVYLADGFPKIIDLLYHRKNVDIYVTGSNKYLFSEEAFSVISGRYVQINMFPYSFKEYMESTGSMIDRGVKYAGYIKYSSFPYAAELKGQQHEIRDYLDSIYNTIVVKDIVSQKKITDTILLKKVLRFLYCQIGNTLSPKKISDLMTAEGNKIDVKTVEKYLKALSENYIIYQVKRYNIKDKQYLKTLEKYYIADVGMRFMLVGSKQSDLNCVLENMIYLELLRRGFDVYVGKTDAYEVDFVAQKNRGIIYYQAAWSIRDKKLLEKELKPLQSIHDHFPKVILTLDDDPEVQYDGIRCINARDWLLGLAD